MFFLIRPCLDIVLICLLGSAAPLILLLNLLGSKLPPPFTQSSLLPGRLLLVPRTYHFIPNALYPYKKHFYSRAERDLSECSAIPASSPDSIGQLGKPYPPTELEPGEEKIFFYFRGKNLKHVFIKLIYSPLSGWFQMKAKPTPQ